MTFWHIRTPLSRDGCIFFATLQFPRDLPAFLVRHRQCPALPHLDTACVILAVESDDRISKQPEPRTPDDYVSKVMLHNENPVLVENIVGSSKQWKTIFAPNALGFPGINVVSSPG
jgi:hypothetical protein